MFELLNLKKESDTSILLLVPKVVIFMIITEDIADLDGYCKLHMEG